MQKPRQMLSPVEIEVLRDLLVNGDNVPANTAENVDRHAKSASRSLSNLEEDGLVENKGRGVWTLTPEGVEAARSLR